MVGDEACPWNVTPDSASADYLMVDNGDEFSTWIVDRWRRIMIVMSRGRRYLNLALVIAQVLRRRFSGHWRWRMRQPDQLSN